MNQKTSSPTIQEAVALIAKSPHLTDVLAIAKDKKLWPAILELKNPDLQHAVVKEPGIQPKLLEAIASQTSENWTKFHALLASHPGLLPKALSPLSKSKDRTVQADLIMCQTLPANLQLRLARSKYLSTRLALAKYGKSLTPEVLDFLLKDRNLDVRLSLIEKYSHLLSPSVISTLDAGWALKNLDDPELYVLYSRDSLSIFSIRPLTDLQIATSLRMAPTVPMLKKASGNLSLSKEIVSWPQMKVGHDYFRMAYIEHLDPRSNIPFYRKALQNPYKLSIPDFLFWREKDKPWSFFGRFNEAAPQGGSIALDSNTPLELHSRSICGTINLPLNADGWLNLYRLDSNKLVVASGRISNQDSFTHEWLSLGSLTTTPPSILFPLSSVFPTPPSSTVPATLMLTVIYHNKVHALWENTKTHKPLGWTIEQTVNLPASRILDTISLIKKDRPMRLSSLHDLESELRRILSKQISL